MIVACNIGPQQGFRWSEHGPCYVGPFARQEALKEGVRYNLRRMRNGQAEFPYDQFADCEKSDVQNAISREGSNNIQLCTKILLEYPE